MLLNDKLKILWTRIDENVKRKKLARLRIWNNFCDETPLQGFLIYRNSHFRYERAIWLMLVAAAICVTLNDSIRTIGQFMDEDLLTKVTMQTNESIVLPNPTVCMTISFRQAIKLANGTAVRNFLRNNKKKILRIFGPLVKRLDACEDGVHYATEYLIKESRVSVPLLKIFRTALATAHYADQLLLLYNSSSDKPSDLGNIWNSTTYVFQFLHENGLNYGEVIKTTASFLCNLADLKVNAYQTDSIGAVQTTDNFIDWCNRQHVTHIGNTGRLCFRPPLFPVVFNFTRDITSAEVYAESVLPNHIIVKDISANFDRTTFETASGENSISVSAEDGLVAADVDITTTRYFPTSKSPCDKTDSWIDCEERCQNDMIKARCGCVQLSSFYINCPHTVCQDSLCLNCIYFNTSDSYFPTSNCISAIEDDLNKCYKRCLKSCSLLTLQFRKTISTRDKGDNRTFLSVRVTRQSYLNIEQLLAMDSQTFVSNLGGNLGLYIGGTFLALIHLCTSIVRLLISLLVAKDDSESERVESSELQQSPHVPVAGQLRLDAAEAKLKSLEDSVAALQEENRLFKESLLLQREKLEIKLRI